MSELTALRRGEWQQRWKRWQQSQKAMLINLAQCCGKFAEHTHRLVEMIRRILKYISEEKTMGWYTELDMNDWWECRKFIAINKWHIRVCTPAISVAQTNTRFSIFFLSVMQTPALTQMKASPIFQSPNLSIHIFQNSYSYYLPLLLDTPAPITPGNFSSPMLYNMPIPQATSPTRTRLEIKINQKGPLISTFWQAEPPRPDLAWHLQAKQSPDWDEYFL